MRNVVPILYRPFDVRHTYYTGRSRGFICRPRSEVMKNMLAGENRALMVPKRVEHVGAWQHAFVTTNISGHVAVSLKTIDYHFPLYLYPSTDGDDLFAHSESSERQPNLNPKLVEALKADAWQNALARRNFPLHIRHSTHLDLPRKIRRVSAERLPVCSVYRGPETICRTRRSSERDCPIYICSRRLNSICLPVALRARANQ